MLKIKNNSTLLGIIAIITSSILFGCGYSLGSAVEASGMSKECNSLWTLSMSIILNLSFCAITRKNPFKRITKTQLLLCIICGICTCWLSNYLFFIAYKYISVAEATMLHFLHPSMIAVFMTVAFKERFSAAKLAAIVCSIASMVLISGGIKTGSVVGIVAAASTGIFYSFYPVLLEASPLKELDGRTVILYMNITGAVCALAVSCISGSFMLPISPAVWKLDMVMSITGFFAYLLSCYAVHTLGATNASFGAMLEPVASCVIAAVTLGETIGMKTLYGGILVLLSVFFCAWNNAPQKAKQQKQQPAQGGR